MSVEVPGPQSKQGPQDISVRTAEQGRGGWSHPRTRCWAQRAGRAGAQAAGEGRAAEDALSDAPSLVAPSPWGEVSHCRALLGMAFWCHVALQSCTGSKVAAG